MRTKNDIETMNILKNMYDEKTKTLNVLFDELEYSFICNDVVEFFNDIHELCEHVGIDIKNVKTIHVCKFTNNVERVVLNATYRVETKTYTFDDDVYCMSRDFMSALNMFIRQHMQNVDVDECIIHMM
jgi:hypothetical protein